MGSPLPKTGDDLVVTVLLGELIIGLPAHPVTIAIVSLLGCDYLVIAFATVFSSTRAESLPLNSMRFS